MTSIRSFGGLSLLDLPPEIRVRIYEFTIPEEIVLQTWDFNADITERVYTIQLPRAEQPRFVLCNKLIQRETLPIFWDRVTLDHSFLSADGKSTISDDSSEDDVVSCIRVSEENAACVRKLIVSTQADGISERIMPCSLPNVRSIDIRLHPSDISERNLQRYYFRARAANNSKNLLSIMRDFFHSTATFPEYHRALTLDLPQILEEKKYQVSIVLTPVKVYQCWSVDTWSGIMHEFRHDATAQLSYDCNADIMSCEFVDADTKVVEFQDTVLPGSGDGDKVRQLYCQTEEVIRVKNMKLLERLICREIEDRGMVPALSALPRRRAGLM